MNKYDVTIIGSGPGGYVAAIRCAQLGLKTALIERYPNLGGTCLNVGCIPSKALLDSSEHFHNATHTFKEHGIDLKSEPKVNLGQMIKRKNEVVDQTTKGIEYLMKKNKIDVLKGSGKIAAGKSVIVTDESGVSTTYTSGKAVIIATGSRSRELPNLPQDGQKIIGYRQAMTLETQPKRMVIVGSGAIGVEFAYIYNAIGTEVTIVEYLPNIVPIEDEDVSKQLEKSFKKSGVKIMTNASVESVDTSGKECVVSIKTEKGEEKISCDLVLSAVGIQANIEGIGLEEIGIVVDKGRILVDEYYQTNMPGYYAIGDIVPGPALAHVASAEGIICVEKIAGHEPAPLDYGNIPGCTYCSPEVASVGMTEKAAKAAGIDIKIGKFPFSASGKASAAGAKDGFVKLIFDAKYGELLGGHMIGANVTEIIAQTVTARKLETTWHEVLDSIHPHPTMSESVKDAIEVALGEAIHL